MRSVRTLTAVIRCAQQHSHFLFKVEGDTDRDDPGGRCRYLSGPCGNLRGRCPHRPLSSFPGRLSAIVIFI